MLSHFFKRLFALLGGAPKLPSNSITASNVDSAPEGIVTHAVALYTGGTWGILVTRYTNNYQLQVDFGGTGISCFRVRTGASEEWGTWNRLDNFQCNTAADLASLLGGLRPWGNLPENYDVDTILSPCAATIANNTQNPKLPTRYGIFACIATAGSYPYAQFVQDADHGVLYWRRRSTAGEWAEWSVVSATGYTNLSDLASALGVLPSKVQNSGTLSSFGIGVYTNGNGANISGLPSAYNGKAVMFIRTKYGTGQTADYTTICYGTENAGDGIYAKYADSQEWIRVDNFGCATAADLASLLGAEIGIQSLFKASGGIADGWPLESFAGIKTTTKSTASYSTRLWLIAGSLNNTPKYMIAYTFDDNIPSSSVWMAIQVTT